MDTPSDLSIEPLLQRHADQPWPELGQVDGEAFWHRLEARLAREESTPLTPVAAGSGMRGWALHLGRGPLRQETWLRRERWTPGLVGTFASRIPVAGTIMVALVLGAGVALQVLKTSSPHRLTVRSYQTTAGQREIARLPNGTAVVLGPATTLSVTTEGQTGRTSVTLIGQALFTVPQNTRAPFVVRAGRTMTSVLGTTFTVRRYAMETAVQIAVADGRIAVRDVAARTAGIVLPARTLAIVNDSGEVRVTPNIAVEDYTAWTTGRLVFNKTRVGDVAAELGRAYNVQIRLADSALATHTLTWSVSVSHLSLADALEAFAAALEAHVVRSGSVITIIPGASAVQRTPHFSHPSALESHYGR